MCLQTLAEKGTAYLKNRKYIIIPYLILEVLFFMQYHLPLGLGYPIHVIKGFHKKEPDFEIKSPVLLSYLSLNLSLNFLTVWDTATKRGNVLFMI